VRTSVEILNMEKDLPVGIRWARDVIDRQMQHMARLLEDLMDVSRVSKGRIELRRERLDLCRIVQDAVETSRPLIDQHQHELTIELPTVPLYVDADRVRMAQVFSNLLNNAAKFTQPKGHISLSVEPRDGHAVVTVRDSGMGIPSDKLTSIFEMFSQVQKPEDRSKGGLGIGLALARQLVELHGGTIQGCSEGEGKGSIFVVRLPLLHDHAPPPSPDGRDGAPLSSQLRVLVVDDNHDAADSLAKLLSLTGNDVATAYDGEAAVTKAELFRPDVIFLDLGLPKQNGYQACKRIRELPWGAQATVIAVTGWGQDVDRLRTQTAGFDQHLVKPVDPVTLLQMLANHDKNKL
jgi:CheY-like chemotaxis protein